MGHVYGYIRVSSKDQNERRQVDALRPFVESDEDLVIEKESGKDFDRPLYQALKARLQPGDTLVILSLDRLGRSYDQTRAEWRDLIERQVGIHVVDMPMLNTDYYGTTGLRERLIVNLLFEIMSYSAEQECENIRTRPREGIQAARERGVRFGRPPIPLDGFEEVYHAWRAGEMTVPEALGRLHISNSTFYRRVHEFEMRMAEAATEAGVDGME